MQSYIKAKKNQLNIFKILKVAAFIMVVSFVVFRFMNIDQLEFISLELSNVTAFLIAIFLIPLNWYLEYRKWSLCTTGLQNKMEGRVRREAFYAGMVTGLLTPNMLGNFIGRLYYVERKDRSLVTLLTLITNQSQFLATLLFGVISFVIYPLGKNEFEMAPVMWLIVSGITLLSFVTYFKFERILIWFGKTRKFGNRLTEALNKNHHFKMKALGWSFLRYSVFILQFTLVIVAFGFEFEPLILVRLAQVYLVSALIPTLLLGKLGVRESVGILILTGLGIGELTILVSSLIVWLMNLVFPTLLAIVLVKRNA